MQNMKVRVKFLDSLWQENDLHYATAQSAGLDIKACIKNKKSEIKPWERLAIPTGLALEIEEPDIAGFIFSRSGLGTKEGLVVSQGVGVVDSDYRGEIIVSLLNTSTKIREIVRGQRIAQLIFMPAYQASFFVVDELSSSHRSEGGFGHTGKL